MNREDFFRAARARVRLTPDAQIDVAAIDKPGTTLHILAAISSAMAEENESRSVARASGLLISTAKDELLDRIAGEHTFQRLPRNGPSAAVIDLLIQRSAPGASSGFVPAGTLITFGGITFAIDEPGLSFSVGELGPFPASATCTSLGASGNVLGSNLLGFLRPSDLFDATLSVVADGDAALGADRELDPDYAARASAYRAGLDRDWRLVEAAALSVPGVKYAVAIEDINPQSGQHTGTISLYVADANGRANKALLARVRLGLNEARLGGQEIRLFSGAPVFQPIALRVRNVTGYSLQQIQASARGAVVAEVNSFLPGADFQRERIASVLSQIPGLVFDPAYPFGVVTPTVNVAAASSATLFRTSDALISFV